MKAERTSSRRGVGACRYFAVGAAVFWAATATTGAQQKVPARLAHGEAERLAERLFVLKVLPVLKAKCFACHGDDPKDVKGSLDLRSRQGMLQGGESNEPALVPGRPEQSLLVRAVNWDELQMPPKENDRLDTEQIGWIVQWIAAGAPWPDENGQQRVLRSQWAAEANSDGVIVRTSGGLKDDWTFRRYKPEDLWAFRPIRRYDVPSSQSNSQNSRHAIDAFLQLRLSETKITPSGRADKLTLIRRATLDLTGLPPTRAQIETFLDDSSPNAFDNVITRLLESPHYGERMAQHWLDVVRYADTGGYANDFQRPHAWRYRDYCIRSFNQDKPFDRFIIEQIAGDELDPREPENLFAVGFLRMGPWEHTGMAVEAVTRQLFLEDLTNTVGQTFLAINMSCFKCHDHKFDPLPTRDYYRMQAILAPTQFADRHEPFEPYENTRGFQEARARVKQQSDEAREFLAGLQQKNRKAIAELLQKYGVDRRQDLPIEMRRGNLNFYGLSDLEKSLEKITRKRIAVYRRDLARYDPYAFSVYNGPFIGYKGFGQSPTMRMPPIDQRRGKPQQVFILKGGALESPGEKVLPGVLSVMAVSSGQQGPAAFQRIPASSNDRRLALAKWIASEENTMTARVIVNRVWQWHFGKGIVATPNSFGKMGQKPTNPELLDYLANWFTSHGWSIKRLHRLMMTSEAYERAGTHPDPHKLAEVDPNNDTLFYFPPRRLSAEELRDSLLAITGELNHEMGGPGIYPEINWEVALQSRQIMGTVAPAYQPSRTPHERNRRTIYTFRYRTLSDPLLEVFNRPGTEFSCAKRDETTVTPQALTLFNSQFVHDRAIALADQLARKHDDPVQRIAAAFQRVYGRQPTADEQQLAADHLRDMTIHHRNHKPTQVHPPQTVMRGMVEELTGKLYQFEDKLTLMNDYVEDLKAWQVSPETRALAELCLVLMNSNEFVYVY